VLGALAAAAFCEFVLDIRTPRSSLREIHSISTGAGYLIADVRRRAEELKKIYGPAESTPLGPGGKFEFIIGGKAVHTEYLKGEFSDAAGIIGVITPDKETVIFPFNLGPKMDLRDSRNVPAASLKARLRDAPGAQRYLDFTPNDWSLGDCINPPAGEIGLGSLGAPLTFLDGVACITLRNSPQPASMMITVNVIEDNAWLGLSFRWLCRRVATVALDKLVREQTRPPDYAACVFVDRHRTGAKRSIAVQAYEVRPDRSLARIGG
jgi:hypothetical protein